MLGYAKANPVDAIEYTGKLAVLYEGHGDILPFQQLA